MSKFREKYEASPYEVMSPKMRRSFKREDKKALVEITKRLRRFGYSDFSHHPSFHINADWGYQPLSVYAKWEKIPDSEKYKDYPNASVKRVLYLARNMQKGRSHKFLGHQLKYKKSFLPYKEILVTGGTIIDYYFQVIGPDDKYSKGHAAVDMTSMVHIELSDLMPNISGAIKKGRPMSRIIPDPRHYYNCITEPFHLSEFLKNPIRPSDLDHIPDSMPRNMEPKLY